MMNNSTNGVQIGLSVTFRNARGFPCERRFLVAAKAMPETASELEELEESLALLIQSQGIALDSVIASHWREMLATATLEGPIAFDLNGLEDNGQ